MITSVSNATDTRISTDRNDEIDEEKSFVKICAFVAKRFYRHG